MQATANLWTLMSPPDSSPTVYLPLTVCGLRCTMGVSGHCPTSLPWFRVTVQQHNNAMALKLKMALTKTPHTHHSWKACPSHINLYNGCSLWNKVIYYILTVHFMLLAALCKCHFWLQYWAKCMHNHVIRLIGSAQNVVVSCQNGLQP